jgi:diguanylate cyclase (GGDEF)-like protein
MVLVVLALLGWLWGLFFWFGAHQRRQLLADRGGELALMASAVSQHAAGMLRAVESNLRTLDFWLASHPDADPLRDPDFLGLVDEMRQSSAGLIDPRMVSEAGQLYYLPARDGRPRADVSDRGYFKVHLGEPAGPARRLHIGDPVLSRATGRWGIPVSLGLAPAARHHGMRVLFAAIELDRLAAVHEPMRFQPDGSITLVRADGMVLSRTPLVAAYVGRSLSTSTHYQLDYGRQPRGSFVSQGHATDGVPRLVSYERLPDFAVTVLVSRGLAEIYANYNRRLRTVLGLSGLLTVAVVAFTLFLHRSQRSHKALQAAQEQLRRLATTDELTGVQNRRAFMETAQREFERSRRYLRPAAVLALDIDHFKRVNDEYGHAGGDLVLQACASRWRLALREHDVLGRIGGEEFCVLLPETTDASAVQIGERLRAVIAATPLLGNRLRVTVSIGCTVMAADDGRWPQMLERADRALYQAKARGRNCVQSLWPAPLPEMPGTAAGASPGCTIPPASS